MTEHSAQDCAAMRPTQADTLAWAREHFPEMATPIYRAAKLAEEAGEVMGAVIKTFHDGTGRKTAGDIAQETAQVVICAMALAESVGFDVFAAVTAEWDRLHPDEALSDHELMRRGAWADDDELDAINAEIQRRRVAYAPDPGFAPRIRHGDGA